MDYFSRFLDVLDALEKEKVDYILVGGFAVILYGHPRITEDIDVFVKPEESNIVRLRRALFSVFADESINEITLSMLNDYPVIRYGSPDGFYIDILCSLGKAFRYEDLTPVTKTIEGRTVRIASAETLYEMKKDTVRPVDKEDAEFLKDLLKKGNYR